MARTTRRAIRKATRPETIRKTPSIEDVAGTVRLNTPLEDLLREMEEE